MLLRLVFACFALLVPVLAGLPAEAAPPKGEGAKEVRPPANVAVLPRLRLAVPADDNNNYRAIELEVWLAMVNPEDTAKISSSKQQIIIAMKKQFMYYKWEAFMPSETGYSLAKALVKAAVDQAIPNSPPIDDVLIRTMILH